VTLTALGRESSDGVLVARVGWSADLGGHFQPPDAMAGWHRHPLSSVTLEFRKV